MSTTGRPCGAHPPLAPRTITSGTAHPTTSVAPDQPPAGAPDPTSSGKGQDLGQILVHAARRTWPALPDVDAAAAVEAGMLAHAHGIHTHHPHGQAADVAAMTGEVAATTQRQGVSPTAAVPIDWSSFGMVIPVLSGSPGAGASVLAATLADTLQLAGCRTLLVDAADPVRSGLAIAARNAGPWVRGPHPAVCVRYSWRARTLLAQLETWLPVLAPGMVPPARFWYPGVNLHVTIVDVGHDSWRIGAHPLVGAGEWLRAGTPMPKPVLVVRATRPALVHAEQTLSRLEPWVGAGTAAAPAQLVVMGAKRWPAEVAGSAGRRVAALLNNAVFIPHDRGTAAGGVDASLTPSALRAAVTPLLRRWGAFGDHRSRSQQGAKP
jgi:hypothetical protein